MSLGHTASQQLPRREDVRLPGKFIEVARAHPRGERLIARQFRRRGGFRLSFVSKQIIARHGAN